MSKSAHLRVADLRAIYRLLDECRDLGDDPLAWRRHLLAGLADLTAAGAGTVLDGLWEPFRPNGVVIWGLENGFDGREVARLHEAFARDGLGIVPMFRPFLGALGRGRGPSLTRPDLVP